MATSIVARLLLDKGAEIDRAAHALRSTPLFIACQRATSTRRGCCWTTAPRSTKIEGTAPGLFVACEDGHVDVARLLLDRSGTRRRCTSPSRTATPTWLRQGLLGAEIDRAREDGAIACEKGHVDAARLLWERGARIHRANNLCETPLYAACR